MQQPSKAFCNADSDDTDPQSKIMCSGQLSHSDVMPIRNHETDGQATASVIKTESMDSCTALTGDEISTFESENSLQHSNNIPTTTNQAPIGSESTNDKSVAIQSETSPPVVNLTPTCCAADVTGSTSDRHSRLQELKPLKAPRHVITDDLQHQTREKNDVVKAKSPPPESQIKALWMNAFLTTSSEFLKSLTLLAPDEYDDSELYGNFQHMVHMLIPSNATTALLAHRGQLIKSINEQTSCILSIRKPEASPFRDNRLLRIYGKAKCICLAQRLVIAYIRAFRAEKGDPSYMDLSNETPLVVLPATSITKAISTAATADKKDEMEVTSPFIWMVQRDEAGKMMGKKGCILASIRRDTGATIHVDDDVVPGTTERRVTLSGSVEAIVAAVKRIKSRSNGRPEVAASVANARGNGHYFAIPYYAVGCLMGVQGSTLKNIAERTGARLQFPLTEDLPLGSLNRILHVQGTPKQAEHARRIIYAKLQDFMASSKSLKTLSLSLTGLKGDKVVMKVLLPSKISGYMLDRRGKLIREISKKSGAHMRFLAGHGDGHRICVFSGDMSCVFRAQRLVLQVIAGNAIFSKRAAPPRNRKRKQRDEQESNECDEVAEDAVNHEELCHEDEAGGKNCFDDDDYDDAHRHPGRRKNVHATTHCCLRDDHKENEGGLYKYDGGMIYEECRRQPKCRGEYAKNENAVDGHSRDEYGCNEYMAPNVPRYRPPMSSASVLQQPATRRGGESNDEYEEDDDKYEDDDGYSYEGDDDGVCENSIVKKQSVKRQPVGSRVDAHRRPIVSVGRRVQIVVSNSRPRDGQSRTSSTDRHCTKCTNSVCPSIRIGTANVRHSVFRRGKGNGRISSRRSRGSDNKRRRKEQCEH